MFKIYEQQGSKFPLTSNLTSISITTNCFIGMSGSYFLLVQLVDGDGTLDLRANRGT